MLFYHFDISPAFYTKFSLMGEEMEMQNTCLIWSSGVFSLLDIQDSKADLQLGKKNPFEREEAVAKRKIFRTI